MSFRGWNPCNFIEQQNPASDWALSIFVHSTQLLCILHVCPCLLTPPLYICRYLCVWFECTTKNGTTNTFDLLKKMKFWAHFFVKKMSDFLAVLIKSRRQNFKEISLAQGCQIFFVYDTKTGKNVPNEHKLYQLVTKYTKCP
jgi:hypothetical protein